MVQWILQRNQQIFLKSSNRTSSLQMNSRAAVKVKKDDRFLIVIVHYNPLILLPVGNFLLT